MFDRNFMAAPLKIWSASFIDCYTLKLLPHTDWGEMAEWFKALVSKTSMGVISSWVRIPLSPPQRNRNSQYGEMLEWPNRRDWKSRVPSQGEPWVRIPPSPPVLR